MSQIVILSGSLSKPSRTRALLETIAERIAPRLHAEVSVVDIAEIAPALAAATSFDRLPAAVVDAHRQLAAADLLVVGSPVYKGSYTGLFKHFLDLLDPSRLSGKVAVLAATGGSDRHALVVEHQLRPLLSFFDVHTVPAAVYACDREFHDRRLADASPVHQRIDLAVGQAQRLLRAGAALALAA